MIRLVELAEAGHFNKSHGIKGEMSATLDIDVDLNDVKCIVVSVDGIFVPFFVYSWRARTSDTCLLTIEGIDSEIKAQEFNNKPFYILRSDIPENEDDDEVDEDGLYASDLVGYRIVDKALGEIGMISGINDSTANVLFIVRTSEGNEIFIPVADEYIDAIDSENETIETNLPEGLIELNN